MLIFQRIIGHRILLVFDMPIDLPPLPKYLCKPEKTRSLPNGIHYFAHGAESCGCGETKKYNPTGPINWDDCLLDYSKRVRERALLDKHADSYLDSQFWGRD